MMNVFAASVLLGLVLVRGADTASAPQTLSAAQIIARDGRLVFSDGSSYYLLQQDHTFRSGPLGESGRTIVGRWHNSEARFTIEGRWGWINGTSPLDDRRTLTLTIYPQSPPAPPASAAPSDSVFVADLGKAVALSRCYVVVNELVRAGQEVRAAEADTPAPSLVSGLPVRVMNAVVTQTAAHGVLVAFDVNRDAQVTLTLRSLQGRRVASLGSLRVRSGTQYAVRWKGTDQRGQRVSAARYVVRIEASAGGQSVRLDKPLRYNPAR